MAVKRTREERELRVAQQDQRYKAQFRRLDVPEERHRTVWAYCDGSCVNKSGNKGGYGVVLKFRNHCKEISGGSYTNTTSSRMEMLAACVAMESVKPTFRLVISSDSQYLVNTMNMWVEGWEKQGFAGKANVDLLKRLLKAYRRFPQGQCHFLWLKGHAGHPENELADRLAGEGGSRDAKIDRRDFHAVELSD